MRHQPMSTPSEAIPRFSEIQDLVKSHYPDADLELIRHAYIFSAQVHRGQTRRTGEPYLVHPVAVARILASMRLGEASVATGLLHDTVEDTLTTLEDIERLFGKEIATLVDGVTKISKMEFQSKEVRQAESFRKMILAMSRDIRILLVKLADRLHNMRTLDAMPPEAQKRIALETREIYAPLAGRLGIYWIRTKLEDLALKYIEPETYAYIKARLEETIEETKVYVDNVLDTIKDKLEQYNITAEIKGRTKEVFSIHRKMASQKIDFDQIHDITAFRIILNSINECYAVLGLMHGLWKPVPGRFKDYIFLPKGNGYQSLHTTVIGPDGNRIEIQIRTLEMDLVAEEGIAAHWSYKEGKAVQPEDQKVVTWLRQMMEWQKDLDDPREFLENVRVDLYPDEVYVFTPTGDVKEFPKGSTPLDFAYSIHTEVGHRCTGARVNGRMVPLKYELKTGEVVEIITSGRQKPSKDWLKYVKTARARTKIRHFILAEERDRSVAMGRDAIERELRKWRMELNHTEKEGAVLQVAQEYGFKVEQDLYASVGNGKLSPKVIVHKLVPQQERDRARPAVQADKPARERRGSAKSGVKVEGLLDVMVKFSKCCNPLPGDEIKGYITKGRGVTVHKNDCINLNSIDSERTVSVSWDLDQHIDRLVKLEIEATDKLGLLEAISRVFTANDSNIVQVNVKSISNNKANGTFMVSVKNVEHLSRIINALGHIKGVDRVTRL
jgi:GTP diphosphokinase / guanosine-3',5'-bis(diphosphate) 3'-diphosphatase